MRSLIAIVAGLALTACASTQAPGPSRTDTVTREFQARVEALDQKDRVVTLMTASGEKLIFGADAAVKNLSQVHVGDLVRGRVTETLAVEVRPATEAEKAAPASVIAAAATAPPGQKPAGMFVREMTAVFTIASIDKAAGGGELRDVDGGLHFVKVRDPSVLDRVKVGDTVVMTYTESLAIEVVAPGA